MILQDAFKDVGSMFIITAITMYISVEQFIIGLIYGAVTNIITYMNNDLITCKFGPAEKEITRRRAILVGAHDGFRNITNSMELFLNWFWDADYAQDMGGVDVKLLRRLFGPFVVIVYYDCGCGGPVKLRTMELYDDKLLIDNNPQHILFNQLKFCYNKNELSQT